jgi:hypothetical protein
MWIGEIEKLGGKLKRESSLVLEELKIAAEGRGG